MRRSSIGFLVLVCALVLPDLSIRGQEMENQSEEVMQAEKLPVENTAVTDVSQTAANEQEHTVAPGDTLWDISARYKNSPWYWPQIWSYNPQISNPHWIYPGQRIKFLLDGQLPTQIVEVNGSLDTTPVSFDEEMPPDLVKLTGPAVFKIKEAKSVLVRRQAFVTGKEADSLGSIYGSMKSEEMLSTYDPVYVDFSNADSAKIGEKYLVIRVMEKIEHPITGNVVGYYMRVLGTLQVTQIEDRQATATITESVDPIFRGDKVAPMTPELTKLVSPLPNSVETKGYVVGSEITLTNLGESNLVFIDQGSQQGVAEGNIFDVVRREDGLYQPGASKREGEWDTRMPLEVTGRIMIVDARETVSTGVVLSSLREIRVGDRVQMSVVR